MATPKPCPFCGVTPYKCEYESGSVRWAHDANDCILSRKFIYDPAKWNTRIEKGGR